MRVLLHTGKGGVGKTTVALATAFGAAKHGHRVFVLSTDAAHSLGDALGMKLGPQAEQVAPGTNSVGTSMIVCPNSSNAASSSAAASSDCDS